MSVPNKNTFAMVRAISFDGDATLWDFESSMHEALARSAEELSEAGLSREGAPLAAAWLAEVREEIAALPEFHGVHLGQVRLAAFEEAIRRIDPGRLDLAEPVCSAYFEYREAILRPYVDVAAVIPALQSRFPLALITNGNTHPAQMGFEDHFEVVIFAIAEGTPKPDPAIYLLAAERLGVEPAACLHVGDHPVEDVDAARRAGMQTIWLNRDGRTWPTDLESPDAELNGLAALPDLV